MKQRTFEFCRREKQKPVIEFPARVAEKLIKQMAAAIIEVGRPAGERNHEQFKA